jgi:hypothetical protein
MNSKKERMDKFIPNNTIFIWYFLYLLMFLLLIQFIGKIIDLIF